ncbi:MAG: hypothetical protein U0531_04660 [Dehalococcoidia bacterium]
MPQNGQRYLVALSILVADDGRGGYEARLPLPRAKRPAAFPTPNLSARTGHDDESIKPAFILSGFKWPANTATWSYNATGKPLTLANDATALAAGANMGTVSARTGL